MNFEDEYMIFCLELLAGVTMILFALRHLSFALQSLMAGWIEITFHKISPSNLVTFLSGMGTSFLIHSRTKTSLMALSYSAAGILNFSQLQTFLNGAQLGTVFTPLLLMLVPSPAGYLFLAAAGVLWIFFNRDIFSQISQVLLCLGLILFGFEIMTTGKGNSPAIQGTLQNVFDHIQGLDFLGVPHGALFLWIFFFGLVSYLIRSTVAAMLFLLVLVYTNMVSGYLALIAVMGLNLGALFWSYWESGALRQKERRATFSLVVTHFMVSVLILVFYEPIFFHLTSMASLLGDPFSQRLDGPRWAVLVGFFHVLYNFIVTLFFLLIRHPLIYLTEKIYKDEKIKKSQELTFLGPVEEIPPSLAVDLVSQEIQKMTAMTLTMLDLSFNTVANYMFLSGDETKREIDFKNCVERIQKFQEISKRVQGEIHESMSRFGFSFLSSHVAGRGCQFSEWVNGLIEISEISLELIQSKNTEAKNPFLELSSQIGKELQQKINIHCQKSLKFFENVFLQMNELGQLSRKVKDKKSFFNLESMSAELGRENLEILNQLFHSNETSQKEVEFLHWMGKIQNIQMCMVRLGRLT